MSQSKAIPDFRRFFDAVFAKPYNPAHPLRTERTPARIPSGVSFSMMLRMKLLLTINYKAKAMDLIFLRKLKP